MTYWRNRLPRPLAVVLTIATVIYPVIVFLGQNRVSPLFFVAIALALIGLRLVTADSANSNPWRFPFVIMAVGVVALAFLDEWLAVMAYPVFINLGLAGLFGYSLLHPPTVIEKVARLRHPDLPHYRVMYCRKVTLVWTVFTLFNAGVAFAAAVWGTIELWALWTGLISYILMGILFGVELTYRTLVLGKKV